jgi:Carboxypeptidase regulatory-like domain
MASAVIPIQPSKQAESGIAWEQVDRGARSLTGRVVVRASLQPLAGSVVEIVDGRGRRVGRSGVSQAGAFVFDSLAAGRYSLRCVRIGFAPARAVVEMPDVGGVAVTVLMAEQVLH